MDSIVSDLKQKSARSIEALKEDLKSIRTGRATPALVENIVVDAYGGSTKLKLKEMGSISTEGASSLIIMPYDPSATPDIERAIQAANLGFSAQNQGTRIRIVLPPLSQEQREKLTKVVSQKCEEKRVAMRALRDDARRKVKQMQENKEITEDARFRLERDIDTAVSGTMDEIQSVKERKEEEITQV